MKAKNLYLAADLLLAAAAASAAYGIIDKRMSLSIPFFLLGASGLTAGIQATIGKTKVTNKSNFTVYCKDEDSTEVFAIEKGQCAENIDGIKVNGKIFKVCDGVHITVNEDGSVSVESFVYGRFVQAYKGANYIKSDKLPEDWLKLKMA